MLLPETFSFNQQNLEDFVTCRRLFLLRHIQKQDWPALESEPVHEHEELMRLGEQFHQLVYQQGIGIPDNILRSSIDDPVLSDWWRSFSAANISSINGAYQYEKLVSIPFEDRRLVAKFDLIIFTPDGEAWIYDWKTSRREPQRKWLQQRMQTLVYPYVLFAKMDPPRILPEKITMTYWYPAFPDNSILFTCTAESIAADEKRVLELVKQIKTLDQDEFQKTDNAKRCLFCKYRSLCGRGEKAGDYHDQEDLYSEDSSAFDIDFDALSSLDYK